MSCNIFQLRKRLEDIMPPDLQDDSILYYKFLKARDFNLDKAEKMLRRHIQWRKHYQLSCILKYFKPKEFFLYLNEKRSIGCDKEGNIVLYVPAGKLDFIGVLKCVKMNDYMQHVVWYCEKWASIIKQQREKEGIKSQQLVIISDFDQMTLATISSKALLQVSLRVMHILQDNFPEMLKTLIIINAPSYYVVLYNFLKGLFSKAFFQKIQVYGQNGWKENFLQTIDEEVLPAFLGGKRTDPDDNPLCETTVSHYGPMPERFYLPEEERCFKDKSRVMKILLSHLSKKDVYFDVMEENSVIQWEFLVIGKDVGFGLFFRSSGGIMEILPIEKYDTEDGVERGFFKTKFTGKYFVTFDNSYSWFKSKEVECCITLLQNET